MKMMMTKKWKDLENLSSHLKDENNFTVKRKKNEV